MNPVVYNPNCSSINLTNPDFRLNENIENVSPDLHFLVPASGLFDGEISTDVELDRYMREVSIMPSIEEEVERRDVIGKLSRLVMQWAVSVYFKRKSTRFPDHEHLTAYAASIKLLTFGSYGLGAHTSCSDIDVVCACPSFSTADDFFIGLPHCLRNNNRGDISEICPVRDAFVQLIRLKVDGISVDLIYSQLIRNSVPEDKYIFEPRFHAAFTAETRNSLSGIVFNKCILELVPNVEVFRKLLRCVKLWAKRRGVYGNLFGFFGGFHLAILSAFVCIKHENANTSSLLSKFFKTYHFWNWKKVVLLPKSNRTTNIVYSGKFNRPSEYINIQLPSSDEYCNSNITSCTFEKIKRAFKIGFKCTHASLHVQLDENSIFRRTTAELLGQDIKFRKLFEPLRYSKLYNEFLKICITAPNQNALTAWLGYVRSRFPTFIRTLGRREFFVDPNPSEYADGAILYPNVVFYWGLKPLEREGVMEIPKEAKDFERTVKGSYKDTPGTITFNMIPASQFPKDSVSDNLDLEKERVPVYKAISPLCYIGTIADQSGRTQA